MMIESQDIDMSALGGEMMPWLEYLPQDVLSFFDGAGDASMGLSGQEQDSRGQGHGGAGS